MLTRDQIQQAYGDLEYLFNYQMERFFEKVISDELRYLQISVFTATDRPQEIYDFIPEMSNRIIIPSFLVKMSKNNININKDLSTSS